MNMQSRQTFVGNPSLSQEDSRDPTMLIAQDPNRKKQGSALEWWYRLTSQKEPAENAPLLERERARRGRLISTVMFFASILFIMGTFIGIFGPNHFIALATGFSLVLLLISSQFNRMGYTNGPRPQFSSTICWCLLKSLLLPSFHPMGGCWLCLL